MVYHSRRGPRGGSRWRVPVVALVARWRVLLRGRWWPEFILALVRVTTLAARAGARRTASRCRRCCSTCRAITTLTDVNERRIDGTRQESDFGVAARRWGPLDDGPAARSWSPPTGATPRRPLGLRARPLRSNPPPATAGMNVAVDLIPGLPVGRRASTFVARRTLPRPSARRPAAALEPPAQGPWVSLVNDPRLLRSRFLKPQEDVVA